MRSVLFDLLLALVSDLLPLFPLALVVLAFRSTSWEYWSWTSDLWHREHS